MNDDTIKLKLYHTGYNPVINPDVKHSHRNSDFGPGFYTTSIEKQAKDWGLKKFGSKGSNFTITHYELAYEPDSLKVKLFESPDEEWIDAIVEGRLKGLAPEGYDIVIGPVADGALRKVLSHYADMKSYLEDHYNPKMYRDNIYDTIERLNINRNYDQYVMLNEKALSHMTTLESRYYDIRGTLLSKSSIQSTFFVNEKDVKDGGLGKV